VVDPAAVAAARDSRRRFLKDAYERFEDSGIRQAVRCASCREDRPCHFRPQGAAVSVAARRTMSTDNLTGLQPSTAFIGDIE